MILRGVTKANLTVIHDATRAYVMLNWLKRARNYNYTKNIQQQELYVHDIDKILSKLAGNVYDVRDFVYQGILHADKVKIHAYLKQKEVAKKKLKAIHANITHLDHEAFITNNTLQDMGWYVSEGTLPPDPLDLQTDNSNNVEPPHRK